MGDNHRSTIGTLLERQTRMLRLVALARAGSDSLHTALVARMQDLPPALMQSITWDQGSEMARHVATADKLGAPVCFCDSVVLAARHQREHERPAARLLP